jgi:hypothetical protein
LASGSAAPPRPADSSPPRLTTYLHRGEAGEGVLAPHEQPDCCNDATDRAESATGTRTLRRGAKLDGMWCVSPSAMPIPDEKSRVWTRPEDYWPPRRSRRSGRSSFKSFKPAAANDDEAAEPRPLLDIVPYVALMLGLAVLAAAIIVLAWPNRTVPQPAPVREPVEVEIGTAPKGWIDNEQPARR